MCVRVEGSHEQLKSVEGSHEQRVLDSESCPVLDLPFILELLLEHTEHHLHDKVLVSLSSEKEAVHVAKTEQTIPTLWKTQHPIKPPRLPRAIARLVMAVFVHLPQNASATKP